MTQFKRRVIDTLIVTLLISVGVTVGGVAALQLSGFQHVAFVARHLEAARICEQLHLTAQMKCYQDYRWGMK